jgi:hypothetical protein
MPYRGRVHPRTRAGGGAHEVGGAEGAEGD